MLKRSMERLKIDLMGIGEMRWPGACEMTKGDGNKVIISGGEQPNRGVGVILNGVIANKLLGYCRIYDRIILMKLKGAPFNMNVLRLYESTEDSTEEKLENFS